MAAAPPPLTYERLAELVEAGDVDTVLVMFTDHYGRFMGKRLDADFYLEHARRDGVHACNYLLTVDMEMEPVPGYAFANWEKGYGDFQLVPDGQTLRLATWLDRTALVLCDIADEHSGDLVSVAPRSILRRQIERAAGLGYKVMAGSELEYYIFAESFRQAASRRYRELEPAGWYVEDYHMLQGTREEDLNAAVRRHLKLSGIPVESTKGEWGPGQHELNLRYCEVLEMADRHAVFKQCTKEIADRLGVSVTFMAKYAAGLGGSSCHLHLSLWQEDENAFAGSERIGPLAVAPVFRHFLAGWLARVPEIMVFYASTVNAYKRYQPGSWAPTAVAWSHDNRTAGFRIVGHGPSLRIECRIPGADCNPYLAFAAALACGLDGIERKLEPPPLFSGDVYRAGQLPQLPRTFAEAIERFSASDFARAAFGAEVVEHYLHFFRTEQREFDRAVTDWERWRYFERI